MPEVLFFIGPPFCGSNVYFSKVLSNTHELICPEELFHADPSLSLRSVILKVVNAVKEGKSIVVSDGAISSKARASYINLIRTKVPDCSLRSLIFKVPAAQASLQCRWAYEWELGGNFGFGQELLDSWEFTAALLDSKLDTWFSLKGADFPNAQEGLDSISELVLPLICDSPYELDLPALFLQWEGIFERVHGEAKYRSGVTEAITGWREKNPAGRVIVISDGTHTCDVESSKGSKDGCTCLGDVKAVVTRMASELPVPVFFTKVDNPTLSGQFAQPPNVGLLAWSQRLHNISFTHKATFYIHSTEAHSRAAISAGVKGLRATKLYENPNMINAVYCGNAAQPPECVRSACVASFGGSADERAKPSLPLLEQAMEAADSGDDGPFSVHMCKAGRVHGMCYRDRAALQRYQRLFEGTATPSSPAPNALFESKVIWSAAHPREPITHRKELLENTPSTPPPQEARTSGLAPSPSSRSQVSQVSLRKEHVAAQAYSPGHFRRGVDCKKAVQHFTSTSEADGTRIKCSCAGSLGRLYELSAFLGPNGITMARCSCPDPAGKLGKCKHVVAMLMKFIDKDSSKTGALGRNLSQSNSDAKRCKAADRTIYCMSPEELVATAREILSEKTTPLTGKRHGVEQAKCDEQAAEGCADQRRQQSSTDSSGSRKRRLVSSFSKDRLIQDEGISSSTNVILNTENQDKARASAVLVAQSTSNPMDEILSTVRETTGMKPPGCYEQQSFPQSTAHASPCVEPSPKLGGILTDQKRKESKKRPSVLDEFI